MHNNLGCRSVLDADMHGNSCRIVFHGRIWHTLDPDDKAALSRLRIFRPKEKVRMSQSTSSVYLTHTMSQGGGEGEPSSRPPGREGRGDMAT